MYMSVFLTCIEVNLYMRYPWRPDDGVGSPGIGVTKCCWELNLDPLQKQSMLFLIAESCLQPIFHLLLNIIPILTSELHKSDNSTVIYHGSFDTSAVKFYTSIQIQFNNLKVLGKLPMSGLY